MKVTITPLLLICLLTNLSFAENTMGQERLQERISIQYKNTELKTVLKSIEQKANVVFSYQKSVLSANDKVTIDVKNETLESVLQRLFTPHQINYRVIQSKKILLSRRKSQKVREGAMLSPPFINNSLEQIVRGTVTDENGAVLPGVTVVVKGTQRATTTNSTGQYNIDAGDADAILVFSFVGFFNEEVPVRGKDQIDIALRLDTKTLEEVLVVGYGTQTKQKISTAISSVKIDDIDQGAGNNPMKMLQGRASGVNVISPSGVPGAKPVVLIRGVGSISGSSAPLYVVDGVPNEGGYPNINPNDIESIEVLKDASAAAIYGSRANSGVILVTTKSGKAGKTSVSFDAWNGSGTIANDIEMANSAEYAAVMKVAVDNFNKQRGTSLTYYTPPAEEIEETDWTKVIARSSARSSNYNLSVSGGNDKTTLYTSFGAFSQEGILLKSKYDLYSFRIKAGHAISPFIQLNTNLSLNMTDRVLLEEENSGLKLLRTAREEQPWYSPYKPDGDYKENGTLLIRHNPIMLINEEDWTSKRYEGIGTISLVIKPFKGLQYTPTVRAFGSFFEEKKTLTEQMVARARSAGWGAIAQSKDTDVRYVIENLVQYSGGTNNFDYSILAGHVFEKFSGENFGVLSDNYANGAFPSSNFGLVNAGPNIYASGMGYDAFALESFIGRLNLSYQDKYIVNASLRTDGASKFSSGKRYGTFPAISAAWLLGKERFLQNQNFINDLKLRASFGVTGSISGVGNFASKSLIVAGSNSYDGQSGFALSQIGQDLTWEKAQQVNLGLDAEILKNKLSISVDVFKQRTTNLLYNKPIQATSGYSTIAANIGTVENSGIEFSAASTIINRGLKWELNGNISLVKNKLIALLDGVENLTVPSSGSNLFGGQMHALIVGQPVSTFFMYRQTGIYQNDSEVPDKLRAKGVRAGDLIYEDLNGDGDITDADRMNVGKAIPDFFGGITSNLSFKGFELNIFAQYSVGGKVLASWRGVNGTEGTDHLGNAFSNTRLLDGTRVEQFFGISKNAATNYWDGPGTSNTMPRPVRRGVHTGYGSAGYNFQTSTRFLEDASFFRVRTVTVAYNLPTQTMPINKVVNGARVFVTLDNFLTLTKYSGYDPEQSFTSSPGSANYGVDFGLQPALKTILFGVNLKF